MLKSTAVLMGKGVDLRVRKNKILRSTTVLKGGGVETQER